MHNILKPKWFIPILFALAVILVVLALPREGKFKYQYQKGSLWLYEDLDAPFDFPILKTQEELANEREELTKNMTPYFTLQVQTEATQLRALMERWQELEREEEEEALRLASRFKSVYSKGIMSIGHYEDYTQTNQIVIVKNQQAFPTPLSEIYTPATALEYVQPVIQNNKVPEEIFQQLTQELFLLLVPNLMYNEAATQAARARDLDQIAISKGIVTTGQRLISTEDVVTQETLQILNSFKEEYNSRIGFMGNKALLLLGQIMLVLICLFILYILLQLSKPELLHSFSEFSFVLFLFVFMSTLAAVAHKIDPRAVLLLPFPVFVLYLESFFSARTSLPIYLIFLLPLAIITDNYQIVVSNAVAGTVALYCFKFWDRGWEQFLSAFMVLIAYALVSLAFHFETNGTFILSELNLKSYGIASFAIIATYPLVFLFEKIFGFVSLSRLRDLADTGNKALRELSEKAPGTMQHSLQVANLAETAARKIGAGALLCRVGALYHDLGKLSNPQYFIENQTSGFNPHTLLTPEESARIVISHVESGMSLAKKYGLPTLVTDFIESHHGHTCTQYFYHEYCNRGGDPALKDLFIYKGKLPVSREQVIVMMADAVEASCRSLIDYTPSSISQMVDKVVKSRITEEQLQHANITYHDINRIQDIFKTRLQDIYHSRISYPDRKRT